MRCRNRGDVDEDKVTKLKKAEDEDGAIDSCAGAGTLLSSSRDPARRTRNVCERGMSKVKQTGVIKPCPPSATQVSPTMARLEGQLDGSSGQFLSGTNKITTSHWCTYNYLQTTS